MVLKGRIIQDFNYTVVMGSTFLGNFVFYPGSGNYANTTVAVAVYKDTLINLGGKTHFAKDLNLPNLLKAPRHAIIELVGHPHKLAPGAIAQYSAHARIITLTN